ncbi:Fur family transcriptional regulator [Desulfomicrobium salsuginis]
MKARMTAKAAEHRLAAAGLEATEHRVRVLMAVGGTPYPSSAPEILDAVRAKSDINRVTVYRILDLLVEHEVLNRLDLGDKSRRFCLREDHDDEHPHFHCTRCDRYLCLRHAQGILNTEGLEGLEADIRHVDIRLEGVCPACRSTT